MGVGRKVGRIARAQGFAERHKRRSPDRYASAERRRALGLRIGGFSIGEDAWRRARLVRAQVVSLIAGVDSNHIRRQMSLGVPGTLPRNRVSGATRSLTFPKARYRTSPIIMPESACFRKGDGVGFRTWRRR